MSTYRIVAPKGMQNAFDEEFESSKSTDEALEAALCWLSDNPIVPSDEDCARYLNSPPRVKMTGYYAFTADCVIEWQRVMFLAPEPEVPEDIRDLLWETMHPKPLPVYARDHDADIIEAYRRGQKAGSK